MPGPKHVGLEQLKSRPPYEDIVSEGCLQMPDRVAHLACLRQGNGGLSCSSMAGQDRTGIVVLGGMARTVFSCIVFRLW